MVKYVLWDPDPGPALKNINPDPKPDPRHEHFSITEPFRDYEVNKLVKNCDLCFESKKIL